MEHSLLHALQLLGIVVTLGGAFLVLALLQPAARALGRFPAHDEDFGRAWRDSVERWVFWAALAAALGAVLDLLVQAAEVKGTTIFGGVDVTLVVRFATLTAVGPLLLWRAAALLLAAAAVRTTTPVKWWLVTGLGLVAAILASSVSHAAAQPVGRAAAVAAQLAHILAAAVWIGVLIHLFVARVWLHARTASGGIAMLAEVIRRFSPIALAMAALLALSGLYSLWRFVGTPGAVPLSAYGLTLVVKLTLALPLLLAGLVNFRIVRPGLLAAAAAPGDPLSRRKSADSAPEERVLQRLGCMLEVEVTAGVLVIAVAGILGSVVPPGTDASLRLTDAQVRALLSPDLPTTAIIDPATLYDSRLHTVDDLRYSEFMHNWSGVFVSLLGLCWLVQAAGGRSGAVAARVWPLLLVPFAGFIVVGSDPEGWLLRRLTLWQALRDPQIVEHQIGGLLVFALAWLGWRDQRKPEAGRPLGYALPALMIFGSFMLLAHAHSLPTISDDLSTLINVQHAVLGGLGLFAGTVRWLTLRGLFPARTARFVWPGLIIVVGLLMALGYREVV